MKQYSYKVIDEGGKEHAGLVESVDEGKAARALQDRGWLVVNISEKREFGWGGFSSLTGLKNQVSDQELATMTRLLSTMLSTGLPLTEALVDLAIQTKGTYFSEVIRSIESDVRSGMSMSTAMGRFPKVFSNLYVNLVKSGEASGKVSETLEKLAEMLETTMDFKNRVKGAMVYPSIVVTAMIGISVLMLTTVIPKISAVYKDYGATLPLPTRILMGLSDLVSNYFILIVLFGVAVYTFVSILRKNQTSDYLINNFMYGLPIFGQIQVNIMLTVMSQTLGTLLGSGVSIIDAISIVAKTMGNDYYRSGLEAAQKQVEKGLPFSLAIARDQTFPLMMSQLLAIGEETGTIDQSLLRLSSYYRELAERQTKTLTTALEPAMILVMGVMVGGLAVAALLPMFNLGNVIR